MLNETKKRFTPNAAPTSGDAPAHGSCFSVSAFGHAPVKIGAGDYVPDPRQLKPVLVEIPVLWLLSQVVPELVPPK